MTNINYSEIDNSRLTNHAKTLPNFGNLAIAPSGLLYLKINNAFIHDLFPMISEKGVMKPDYFQKDGIGAHVSVIYPEEINSSEIFANHSTNQLHYFTIKGFFSAELEQKKYFVLGVNSPSLSVLREKAGLSQKLFIKNVFVSFHITLAWCIHKM